MQTCANLLAVNYTHEPSCLLHLVGNFHYWKAGEVCHPPFNYFQQSVSYFSCTKDFWPSTLKNIKVIGL